MLNVLKKVTFITTKMYFLFLSYFYIFIFIFIFIFYLITIDNCAAENTVEKDLTLEYAIKTAIENNTDLFISEKQIDINEGNLQSAGADFDVKISSSISYSNTKRGLFSDDTDRYDGDKSAGTLTNYNLNYSQKKRSGNIYNISVSSLQELDNKIPSEKKHNTGNVNLSVTMPLAKGKGKNAAAALENSAAASLEAGKLDYDHNFAAIILKTANAYWDYCMIYHKLEILKQAENEARQTVTDANILYKKGSIHKEELRVLEGSLNEKINLKIQFENARNEAGEKLKLMMGIYDEKPLPYFKPANKFPEFTEGFKKTDFSSLEIYLEKAFKSRPDFLAALKRLDAAGIDLISAKDSIKPKIDLQIGAGYNGIAEGTSQSDALKALNRNLTGANASAALIYEWPCANNASKGKLKQNKAVYEQREAKIKELKKQIRANIAIALSDFIKAVESLESAKKSIDAYKKSVDHEIRKYSIKNSSSIDLISLQDRTITARANLIDAMGECVKSLIALKYELGLIHSVYFTDKTITFSELTNFNDIK